MRKKISFRILLRTLALVQALWKAVGARKAVEAKEATKKESIMEGKTTPLEIVQRCLVQLEVKVTKVTKVVSINFHSNATRRIVLKKFFVKRAAICPPILIVLFCIWLKILRECSNFEIYPRKQNIYRSHCWWKYF